MAPMKLSPVFLVLMSMFIVLEGLRTCKEPSCSQITCFSSCSCLGSLVDCSKRELVDVPKNIPDWVEILDLDSNRIVSIDDLSFSGLDNLTELFLSHNELHIINGTNFQNLLSLRKLILNHNFLVEFPKIKNLHLTHLSLQHNEIHSLSSFILEDLPKLQNLDLSFNNLVNLSANTFGNSSSLTHLSLSFNRIASLEKGLFGYLTFLESLKLNQNNLSSIPNKLFKQLSTLKLLEINSNSLTQIESLSFQGMESLVVLKLRHNGIIILKDGAFYGLTALKKLHLDYNNINNVTKGWLYGLTSLQYLFVSNNDVSVIQDDALDSGTLIELDLSFNKLQAISSKSFNKLNSLKNLILSDNHITYIEDNSFNSLYELRYLELENNQVSWTIEDSGKVFTGLVKLTYLGLANNEIKSVVKRTFGELPSLEVLNMTQNEIITIEKNAFDDLTQLRQLYLNTSSLLCDCHLAWMSQNRQHEVDAKCGFPKRLQGISVYDVSPADMLCDISPKPTIVKKPASNVTLTGENVTYTLECQARTIGIYDMEFHWRRDGKPLNSSRNLNMSLGVQELNSTHFTSFLYIKNIQENEGFYQCVASNDFGSAYSEKFYITVLAFPVFTKTPTDVAIKPGGTARLECGARGRPRPDIFWQKDGGTKDFPAALDRRMHFMPEENAFFIVAAKLIDTGVYSCNAQNDAGTNVANATLTVLEPPSFAKKMEDKEAEFGETAVLKCMAFGSPVPEIRWRKDGRLLHATDRHFLAANSQLLVIVGTQGSDAGEYTCEMYNAVGMVKGRSHLKVLQGTTTAAATTVVTTGGFSMENPYYIGIIVTFLTICVFGTSAVWVMVIYRSRKRRKEYPRHATTEDQPHLPAVADASGMQL